MDKRMLSLLLLTCGRGITFASLRVWCFFVCFFFLLFFFIFLFGLVEVYRNRFVNVVFNPTSMFSEAFS